MRIFSAQHYRMIARRLAESKAHVSEISMLTGIYVIEGKLIELFEADNPQFDRTRFIEACQEKA